MYCGNPYIKLEMQMLCSSGNDDNWAETPKFGGFFTNFLGRINQSDNVENISLYDVKNPLISFFSSR